MFWHILHGIKHKGGVEAGFRNVLQLGTNTHRGSGFPSLKIFIPIESAKSETPFHRNITHCKMAEWKRKWPCNTIYKYEITAGYRGLKGGGGGLS